MNCIIHTYVHSKTDALCFLFSPTITIIIILNNDLKYDNILVLVRKFDVSKSTSSIVGLHSEGEVPSNGESIIACSCLSFVNDTLLASAGWDSKFYLWDVRCSSEGSISKPVSSIIQLPGKAFSMDSVNGNRVVVSTSGRKTCIIDVRMNKKVDEEEVSSEMVLNRDSSLKYQTRVVRFFPDGKGMAFGSIEGRVAIEFLDELGVDSKGMYYLFIYVMLFKNKKISTTM